MKAKLLGMLAGVFAILGQCAVANALSITQPQLFDLTAPTATFTVTNVNNDDDQTATVTVTNNSPQSATPQTLTFNKFDTTLGNLTAVTITFTTTEYSANVTVDATNSSADEATFFADATMDRSIAGSVLTSAATQQENFSASCKTAGRCNDSVTDNTNFVDPASPKALSFFNGPGTFDLAVELISALGPRVDPDNGSNFAGDSTFTGTLDAKWKGNVTVEYTYDPAATPVPEPLSLCLLLGGLGGIALSRRRRRREAR